jgi:hypothetical protein
VIIHLKVYSPKEWQHSATRPIAGLLILVMLEADDHDNMTNMKPVHCAMSKGIAVILSTV